MSSVARMELESVPAGNPPFLSSPTLQPSLRFLLIYLFLSNWIWFDELAVNPTRLVRPIYDGIFFRLIPWLGAHLFRIAEPIHPKTFLDTRYTYVLLCTLAIISLVSALIWDRFDREGRQLVIGYKITRVWIRYTLAYMILIYAMYKVFRLQFPFPHIRRLIEPLGDYSPMGLLWNYVGYSAMVTIFPGIAEAAGAALILFRRTVPLGALILVVVMSNVALMDFGYDVSVKMLAAHFLLMSAFLLAHDGQRLLNVLVFNRSAPAANLKDYYDWLNPRVRRFLPVLKVLVVLYVLVPFTVRTYRTFRKVGPYAAHMPLYGLYKVDKLAIDGQDQPLRVDDPKLWHYVVLEELNEFTVQTTDNDFINFGAKYDFANSTVELEKKDPLSAPGKLVYSRTKDGLILTGKVGDHMVVAQLSAVDLSRFNLVNRGFNWINEASFSR